MSRQFANLGLSAIRTAAVDGNALPVEQIEAVSSSPDRVSRGAIGCFLSHRRVWEMIGSSDQPYAAVFEDDVHISQKASDFLRDHKWIPADADIVHLEKSRRFCRVYANGSQIGPHHKLHRAGSRFSGTASYIISRQCAKHLVKTFTRIEDEFDMILFYRREYEGLSIYKIAPSLCIQDRRSPSPTLSSLIPHAPEASDSTIGIWTQKVWGNFLRNISKPALWTSLPVCVQMRDKFLA